MHNFVMGMIQRMNPLAKNGILPLWGLIAVIGLFVSPSGVHAAIGTTTQNWPATPIYGAVAYPSAAITYNAVAGTNRLLVVGISSSTTQVAQAQPTVSYGGTAMTPAIGYSATATKQHSYLFYLPIGTAAVDDTGKTINVTISGGTSNYCIVNAAVYTGVDQVSPVGTPVAANRSSNNTSVSTAVGPYTLAVNSGERGIAVLNAVLDTYRKTTPTQGNAPTIAIGTTGHLWSQVSTVASAKMINSLRTTFATTINANTNTASEHVSSTTSLNSTAAIAIKPIVGITVSNGSSVAGNKAVYANDGANSTNVVVDAFAISADSALTVSSITFTSNANTTSARVSGIKIWRKVGATLTAWESGDVQLGATATANGGAVTFSGFSEPVSSTVKNYIVTYDIATSAPASTSTILTGTITAISPTAISLTDTAALSANVYIYPTLTVGTGTEPATARLWKSSPATRLDAFTLGLNSPTDTDTVTNVTIRMTPKYITGGSGGTISKFKAAGGIIITDSSSVKVSTAEAVCSTTGVADGFDTCSIDTNIPVTGTQATYYVVVATADVINPSGTDTSGTATGYYVFNGTATALSHSNSNNKLVLGDSVSQTLLIDVEKPTGPATATATTGTSGGQISLVWDNATDANGGALDGTKPFVIMRGLTQPSPNCIDGTDLSTVPGATINYGLRTAIDVGLVDTTPTRYYYRLCAKDTLGNLSDGAATFANSAVTSDCNNPPNVTLTGADGLAVSQIIKSKDSQPFRLLISNNDIGDCPDVNFTVNLANQTADKISGTYTPDIAHFDKNIEGSPFPGTVTVGRGGTGAPIARSVNIYITGNDAANQLEKYIFSINVSEATHNNGAAYSFTTPPVTGLLNDMPPIVHNSSNMAKTTYGTWGETFTCATCHSNSTTNIKGVFQVISTQYSGRKNVVFTKISSVATDYEGVLGNDKRPNKDSANYVCAVCHHRTTQHQYSASKVSDNSFNGTDWVGSVGPLGTSAYNDDHHNSRDCVKCHTHNTAFRSILGVCGDCHGNKTTGYSPVSQSTMVKDVTMALGPSPFNYGAHARHNVAKMTCAACHSNTNHGLDPDVWQGDNKLDMGFLINKDTFPGFNPNVTITGGTYYGSDALNPPFFWFPQLGTTLMEVPDTNAACSTYCHGAWAGNAGNNTTPIWVAADQAACGACHYGTGAVPPTSGSHAKHAGNTGAGLGIACNKCHATYASYTGSAHINGNVEWKFAAAYPGATYKSLPQGSTNQPAPSASYGTCSNLYCHSTVHGPNGTGLPTYSDVDWGGTAACGSCHADPNTSGSHPSHEDAVVAFDCHVCHNTGGTTSPLNHANGSIDFQFTGLGQNTVYSGGTAVTPGSGYGTCSASNCHGRFTRVWGTLGTELTLCDKCHGSATSPGGFYNTRGPDGTLSIYSAAIGVHDIHLQNPNSPRKAAFARFTSFATGFSCRHCHAMPSGPYSPGHIDNPLPAETPFSHMSSLANTGETKFSYYTSPSYSIGTQTCSAVWCHGAGMNSNNSTGPYAGVAGAIQRTNPVWNETFLNGNGANDCTKCHAMPPPAPDAGYIHYGATQDKCKDCHVHLTDDGYGFKNKSLHVNGTIDGGCDKCHGYPPINNIIGDSQGLATPAQGALRLGTAGAHNAHVLNPNIGKSCETCHYNYNRVMTSDGSGKLEIGFNAYNGTVTSGTFSGYSNTGVHPQWLATGPNTNIIEGTTGANVCSNLYCHGGGSAASIPARPVLGGGTNITPNWENGSADSVCGSCHGADTTAVPAGGSHAKHALTGGGGPEIQCIVCHMTSTDNNHVDGAVSWKLNTSNPLIGREGAAYNGISSGRIVGLAPRGTTTVGDDYRNCTNIYCHSNVQGANGVGAPTTHATVKWGGAVLACDSCHKDMATDATGTGSHLKHANTGAGNMALSCGYCHQDGGSGTISHADNLIFVNFTGYVSGTYSNNNRLAGSAAGYGTCSATFCHGTATSPAWGTPGPLACDSCHGASANRATSPGWSGRHATHYNYSTVPTTYNETLTDYSSDSKYRFNCKHCHDADASKHSLKPYSSAAYARVFFGLSTNRRGVYQYGAAQGATDNGFKYTAGSCNTSYCHSNGRGGAPLVTSLTWITPKTAGSNCLYCHDGKKETGTSTLSARHDRHMNPSVNTSIGLQNGQNCQDCHMKTIAADNVTIINRVKHVSGFVDFSSVHGGPTNYNPENKVCSNVYCHSNGNVGATVYVNMTGQKAWGGTVNTSTCNFCHGRTNPTGTPDYANGGANTVTANLHSGHMIGSTDTTGCSQCHRRTASATIANKFVDYSAGPTHMNGSVNIYFDKSKSFIGTKATAVQAGNQVTCTTIICHGSGAPVWGADTTIGQCQKCHGSKSVAFQTYTSPQVAPGVSGGTDTTMTKALATDARVGAHERHLATSAMSSAVKCRECHVPVTAIKDASHWNYTTATLTFSGRATANGHAATAARSGGIIQCSNTNCHTGKSFSGSAMIPAWNAATLIDEGTLTVASCNKCHGFPPKSVGAGGTALSYDHSALADPTAFPVTTCTGCHSNMSDTATTYANIFGNNALHVNGSIQASGGHAMPYPGSAHKAAAGTTPWATCTGCHSNGLNTTYPAVPVSSAPDCTGCHLQGLKTPSGTSSCYDCHGASATNAMPNGNTFPNYSGSHSKHVVGQGLACTDCHSTYGGGGSDTTHGFSDAVAHDISFVNVTSTTSQFSFSRTGKGSCSNIACHGSAEWGTKLECDSCHSYDTIGGTWGSTKHLDGATAEGWGAHAAHIDNLKAQLGVTLNAATDTYGSAAFNKVCGACHSQLPASHTMNNSSQRLVNFNGAITYKFGPSDPLYNGTSGTATAKTCSNISCHFGAAPRWQ